MSDQVKGNFIVVIPDEPKALAENGVIIPENSRRHGEFCRGKVVGIGTGMPGYPLDNEYQLGEFVTFVTSSGKVIPFGGGNKTALLVPHLDVRIREVQDVATT